MIGSHGWPRVVVIAIALTGVGCTSSGTVAGLPVRGIEHPTAAQRDWSTYDRTAARSGVSITSPSPKAVRKSWTRAVDGLVYVQPLIVGSEVIIATENDTVYALSESTGKVRWSRHLARPVPLSRLQCGNIDPSGITGTPVADPAIGRLFVVTYTSRPAFRHTLWALNLRSGRTVWHRPIDVRGSDPRAQQERGALVLLGSTVYVPFGGLFGDCSDYKGRVAGAPVSGQGRLVSFTTPSRKAGIWAPAGESVRDGSIYVATGNGSPPHRIDDSDSVLRLSRRLKVIGRFTPADWQSLSTDDKDLASTAPAMLPGGLTFQVGKEGVGYVLSSTRLGGTGGQLTSSNVCEKGSGSGGDAVIGDKVVFSCSSSLRAISVTPGTHGRKPAIHRLWSVNGSPGPPIIAGGVVWDVSQHDMLFGYRLSDGKPVFSARTASVGTSFPSLAASQTRLVVPEGHEVVCFVGI